MKFTRAFQVACLLALGATPAARAQSPELVEAVRVQRAGVAEQARRELEACQKARCPSRERLALLTGVLELSDGDAEAAAKRLGASKPPKGLEAFHAWYLGVALAWSEQPAAAVKALERAQKTAPGWLVPQVQARLGELWLELGKADKARPLLEAAAEKLGRTPELTWGLALAFTALKDGKRATAALEELALRAPLHPHGLAALARLEEGGAWKPTFEQRLRRAQAMLDAGDAAKCLAALEGLEAPAGKGAAERTAKLSLLRGQALLARGRERDAEAQANLQRAAEGPPAVAAQALFTSGRRLMRLQDNAGARAAFAALDEKYPTAPGADEGAYLGAWLAMNSGDFETAQREFERFEERHADSKKRDEARWFRGFTFLRAKRYAEAREVLLTLPRDFQRSSLVPQALYWAARAASLALATPGAAGGAVPDSASPGGAAGARAAVDGGPAAIGPSGATAAGRELAVLPRAAPDAGAKSAAPSTSAVEVVAEYRALVRGFPGTFYGLLASERLAELGVDAPLPFTVTPKALPVKRPPALDLAAALAETGLLRDAAKEVSVAVQRASAADALTWGHALQALGDFNAAHGLAARHLWGPVYAQQQPEALALMYPRAFRASVEAWSTQHGLEPALAWAIMRRESAFAPAVTSSADARGLMQIIPPTARAIAKELKTEAPEPAELYSPDTNIRFGTWYLHALLQRLGHPTLVAGAYNGGPSAVARWARERGELPLDQWVEEIPFKETRGYVKQVTVDLFIYRQLYGGKQERLALAVPSPKTAGVDF